jgi:hypothetical protein
MTVEGPHRSTVKPLAGCRKAQSSLVRRLVQARDDPAKQRIRRWFCDIDDEQLSSFGLTPEDIALLRGSGNSAKAGSRPLPSSGTRPPNIADQKGRALIRQRFPRRPSRDRRSA